MGGSAEDPPDTLLCDRVDVALKIALAERLIIDNGEEKK